MAIESWKHFIEATGKSCSSNLSLAVIIKIIKNVCEEVNFKKIWNERYFSYISRVFISVVKQLCYVIAFLLNTSQWLLTTFKLVVARSLQDYESKIQDIKKKGSENFIECFSYSKDGKTKCVNTKKFVKIKKIVVYDDKSFIKIIVILLLIVRFVKSSD